MNLYPIRNTPKPRRTKVSGLNAFLNEILYYILSNFLSDSILDKIHPSGNYSAQSNANQTRATGVFLKFQCGFTEHFPGLNRTLS